MIVYKPGQSLGVRNLGALMRDKWNDERETLMRIIAKRTSRNPPVPLDDGEGDPMLADPGEYREDPDLDSLSIEVRALTVAQVQRHQIALQQSVAEIEAAEGADAKIKALQSERAAVHEFLSDALVRVYGLEDGDGPIECLSPLTVDMINLFGTNRLLPTLLSACNYLQSVRGEQRKNSGVSQRRISPSSIATPATQSSDFFEGAMMTGLPVAGTGTSTTENI